ncbi:MucR family transcriptional regulator [Mesorhizobium sp. NPDC059054]|uniref:MucR family transcriptional regulator n=1 Tax=unclassified Mesorhizobium TaxID=325217 RepID=UPI0036CC2BEF
MAEDTEHSNVSIAELTATIIGAYVSNNPVPVSDLPIVIASVANSLRHIKRPQIEPASEPPKPAVSVRRSIHHDYLISLEDGQQYRTLKRHLTTLGLTPEEYRAKWNLPPDYPMVAASYSAQRSELAKKLGLGRKPSIRRRGKGKAEA